VAVDKFTVVFQHSQGESEESYTMLGQGA